MTDDPLMEWVEVTWCCCPSCLDWLPESLLRRQEGTLTSLVPRWIMMSFGDVNASAQFKNVEKIIATRKLELSRVHALLERIHNSGPEGVRAWLILQGLAQ